MAKVEITSDDGDNGDPKEAPGDVVDTGRDPVNGRFLPGHVGIGGRPPKPAFDDLVRRMAKDLGESVETIYDHLTAKLYELAKDGDMKAMGMFFDRGLGAVEKATEINVDARSINITQPPDNAKLKELAQHLLELTDGNDTG